MPEPVNTVHEFNPDESRLIARQCNYQVKVEAAHAIFCSEWQGKKVAIKLFEHNEWNKDFIYARYNRERTILELANAEGAEYIVGYYGYGYTDNYSSVSLLDAIYGYISYYGSYCYFLVMPYMAKGDLFEFIYSEADLEWGMSLSIMAGIAHGVSYLHAHGYVHGDIKSPNVLLGDDYHPYLCDFDLTTEEAQRRSATGTQGWMAPEVIEGEPNKLSSDVYSTAVIFWELVLQKNAGPEAKSVPLVNSSVLASYVPPEGAREYNNFQIRSTGLASLIRWCWQREPTHRPSISQVEAELALVIAQSSV